MERYNNRKPTTKLGQQLTVYTNSQEIKVKKDMIFFDYLVTYLPEIPDDQTKLKRKVLSDIHQLLLLKIGPFVVVGNLIYALKEEDNPLTFEVKRGEVNYEICVKRLSNKVPIYSNASKINDLQQHILNEIIKGMVRGNVDNKFFKDCYYNTKGIKQIKAEGQDLNMFRCFNVSLNTIGNKFFVKVNTRNKIINNLNCLDMIDNLQQKSSTKAEFREAVVDFFVGRQIKTNYNNTTYIISAIDFDSTPMTVFSFFNTVEKTHYEYFAQRYKKKVQQKQFLFKAELPKQDKSIYLVPELCLITGITDDMRSNFKLMKSINEASKVYPDQYIEYVNSICSALNSIEEKKQSWSTIATSLSDFNLEICKTPLRIQATQLEDPTLNLKNGF